MADIALWSKRLVVALLLVYLMVAGVGAAIALVANFPTEKRPTPTSTGGSGQAAQNGTNTPGPAAPAQTPTPSANPPARQGGAAGGAAAPTGPAAAPAAPGAPAAASAAAPPAPGQDAPTSSQPEQNDCKIWLVPVCATQSPEQQLMLLAFLAGMIGSFLHAAQSLSTYVGNDDFKLSWTAWYVLRPWIGGVLGFTIYFVARAGLIGGAGASTGDGVNVYGLVAIGMLGGWFSKTTTDKLQEVFSTLFKTDADKARKDKLTPDTQPVVKTADVVKDSTGAVTALTVTGSGFADGAKATIGGTEVKVAFKSATELLLDLTGLGKTGSQPLVVTNPKGIKPASEPFTVNIA